MSVITRKYFLTEKAAYNHLESVLWPDGVVCPHCKMRDRASKMKGKATRIGLWKCYACRKQFTVPPSAPFCETSHMPLHKMLQAVLPYVVFQKGH